MSAVENIRAALDDATNGPWIGAGPSFGAPHAEYLDSVVEDVDHDDAATICRDAEHLAELRAYELTVSNLREQLAQQASQVAHPDNLEQIIDDYVDDYVMEGDDGTHWPTESEKCLLKDAVMGLLADHEWNSAWGKIVEGPKQAPRVPMTNDEIIKYFDKVSTKLGFGLDDILAFTYGALCAQSHHGTKEKP